MEELAQKIRIINAALGPKQTPAPCPFCGSSAKVKTRRKKKRFPYYVQCGNEFCGCRTDRWNTKLGAIAAWNRRDKS